MSNNLYYDTFSFDNFNYFIGVTDQGLAFLERDNDFVNKYNFNLVKDLSVTNKYKEELIKYFKNELTNFSLELDLIGTDFQKSVWKILYDIPYGVTVSYSEVATRLGDIKKVRAVSNAIGKNNILIVIPCHRVLSKDNKLTGFSSGLDLKEYLLKHEGINNYKY